MTGGHGSRSFIDTRTPAANGNGPGRSPDSRAPLRSRRLPPRLRAICADYGIEPDGEEGPIMAIGGSSNADLILNASTLGYLNSTWETLDCTYGLGRFWRKWSPDPSVFRRHDLNPEKAPTARWTSRRSTTRTAGSTLSCSTPVQALRNVDGGWPVGVRCRLRGGGVPFSRGHPQSRSRWDQGMPQGSSPRQDRESGNGRVLAGQVPGAGRVGQGPLAATSVRRFRRAVQGVRLVDMFHLPGHRAQPKGVPRRTPGRTIRHCWC